MHEEQRMILRMLEEGKITAEEAEVLLKALGEGSKSTAAEPESSDDPWVRLEKMGEDFASKVEVATERFSRSLENNFGDKLSKLPKILSRVPFLGYEETQEFTRVIKGKVGSGEVIAMNMSNANGPIRVQGWDEDDYQLTVVQRLRGSDRDHLSKRTFDPRWEEGAERSHFELSVPILGDASVALDLRVPKDRLYELELSTQNGSLHVEHLKATSVEVNTVNGSVYLHSLKANSIRGGGGNGSCEMKDVEAKVIRHKQGNGSYRLSVTASDVDLLTTNGSVNVRVARVQDITSYRLRTTNGSIRVTLPPQSDLGVALNVQTSVGRISIDHQTLEIGRQERQGGGAVLVAHSLDYSSRSDKLDLDASSTSGSIVISTREN